MAEPVDLAEFLALERKLSTAAPQKNTETARIPTRAALNNSPQITEQPRLLDQVRARMRRVSRAAALGRPCSNCHTAVCW